MTKYKLDKNKLFVFLKGIAFALLFGNVIKAILIIMFFGVINIYILFFDCVVLPLMFAFYIDYKQKKTI